MADDDATDLSHVAPPAPGEVAELRRTANDRLRRWLAADEAAVLASVDAIGADAIRASSDLVARLRVDGSGAVAERALEELRALVEAVHAPPPRPRFAFLSPRAKPVEERLAEAEPRIAALLDTLARERDRLLRDAVGLGALEARMGDAEAALEDAVRLLRALEGQGGAAAREIAGTDPARAAFLRGPAAGRVVERTRDVLTQLVVARQARLSLRVLLDGQDALARAIERTGTTTVGALRTAVAARRSLEGGRRMSERAALLDPEAARRAIDGALGEMRDALGREG